VSESPVTIGVISDTHGLLRTEAIETLRGSDHIIHAGDVGSEEILEQLAAIAPLTVVRGNVDRDAWSRRLPQSDVLQVGGVSIYVLHNLQEVRNGVLYFNPGSAGSRRFRLPVTVGRFHIAGQQIKAEILELKIRSARI
jgi:uncharacterized protein